jgi:hypothetical protein
MSLPLPLQKTYHSMLHSLSSRATKKQDLPCVSLHMDTIGCYKSDDDLNCLKEPFCEHKKNYYSDFDTNINFDSGHVLAAHNANEKLEKTNLNSLPSINDSKFRGPKGTASVKMTTYNRSYFSMMLCLPRRQIGAYFCHAPPGQETAQGFSDPSIQVISPAYPYFKDIL